MFHTWVIIGNYNLNFFTELQIFVESVRGLIFQSHILSFSSFIASRSFHSERSLGSFSYISIFLVQEALLRGSMHFLQPDVSDSNPQVQA